MSTSQRAVKKKEGEIEREKKKPFPGNCGSAGCDREECQTKGEWPSAVQEGKRIVPVRGRKPLPAR